MDRRKELKLAYKQNPQPMGVYLYKNNINGKILVGSSMNLPGKKNSIDFQLKMGGHSNKAFQADYNLLGPEAFTFEILETLKYQDITPDDWRNKVNELEEKWLKKLKPYGELGYNKEKAEK
ncbi:GIY-YIG nuclease family protein [Dendrosporobacter sp. 1207_IL3150]|uniref:GIY-YIG nuclease family protein n=1 Tax=Dendrosporobacter sp. 1207_IL3150 TaxID=3084054 RepID=UPI002FDA7A67